MEVITREGSVEIGAFDPNMVRSVLIEGLGAGARINVVQAGSGFHPDSAGRVQAGEHLHAIDLVSAHVAEERNCTAGPGAYEWRSRKANNEAVKAEFVLTAGHCFPVGEHVEKSVHPRGTDNFKFVGKVSRTAFPGHQHYEVDAEAIRLEGYSAPQAVYRAGRSEMPIHEAGWIRPEDTLCWSGVSSGVVRCGEAVGIRAFLLSSGGDPHHGRELGITFKPFSAGSIEGDSGSPVWEARTQEIVGILDGSNEGNEVAAPLLRPHGFPYEKAPGALNVLDAGGGGELSLERAR